MKPTKELAACENCDAAIDTKAHNPKQSHIFIEKGTMTLSVKALEARKSAEMPPLTHSGAGNPEIDIAGHYCNAACLKQFLMTQNGFAKKARKAGKKASKKRRGSRSPSPATTGGQSGQTPDLETKRAEENQTSGQ